MGVGTFFAECGTPNVNPAVINAASMAAWLRVLGLMVRLRATAR